MNEVPGKLTRTVAAVRDQKQFINLSVSGENKWQFLKKTFWKPFPT